MSSVCIFMTAILKLVKRVFPVAGEIGELFNIIIMGHYSSHVFKVEYRNQICFCSVTYVTDCTEEAFVEGIKHAIDCTSLETNTSLCHAFHSKILCFLIMF